MHNEGIPERDLLIAVRSLLQAGADVQDLFPGLYPGMTVLEAATTRKSALACVLLELIVIAILLGWGGRRADTAHRH
jgi:hypothetical protein